MRVAICALLVVAVAALFAVPASAQEYFVAQLEGSQEVPPTSSSAAGYACFVLDANLMLYYEVSYVGLSGPETMSHIHGPAPAGANAGVVFAFAVGTPKIGSFGPLTLAQYADLAAGSYYVNVHTAMFPGGEIRGQIGHVASACVVPVEETSWGAVKAHYE